MASDAWEVLIDAAAQLERAGRLLRRAEQMRTLSERTLSEIRANINAAVARLPERGD